MLRAPLHEQEIRRAIGAPGEGDFVVEGVAPLDANEDRCLYFIKGEVSAAVRESLTARNGCIVIVRRGSALTGGLGACQVLEVDQPRAAIAKVLAFINAESRQPPWVLALKIAREAVISPLSVVEGNVEIGEGAVVEPFCTIRSEEHTSELQSRLHLVCRLLLEKKKKKQNKLETVKHKTKHMAHV